MLGVVGQQSYIRLHAASGYKLTILAKKKLWMKRRNLPSKRYIWVLKTYWAEKILLKPRLQSVFFSILPLWAFFSICCVISMLLDCFKPSFYISFNLVANFYKEKDKLVFAGTGPQHNLFLFTTPILIGTWEIMYRSNRSFNMPSPPGNPPGIWLFWKWLFKFPPTRAKMPFKCHTLGSFQVIKCPHPGDISHAQKWQEDGGNAFSCRTKSL